MTDKQINEYIRNLAQQEIIKDKIKQIDELQAENDKYIKTLIEIEELVNRLVDNKGYAEREEDIILQKLEKELSEYK